MTKTLTADFSPAESTSVSARHWPSSPLSASAKPRKIRLTPTPPSRNAPFFYLPLPITYKE